MPNVSPNIGLPLTEADEQRNYIELRMEVSGNQEGSGFLIIDKEIGDIKDWKIRHVIFSSIEPTDQSEGDTWNEIISE